MTNPDILQEGDLTLLRGLLQLLRDEIAESQERERALWIADRLLDELQAS